MFSALKETLLNVDRAVMNSHGERSAWHREYTYVMTGIRKTSLVSCDIWLCILSF